MKQPEWMLITERQTKGGSRVKATNICDASNPRGQPAWMVDPPRKPKPAPVQEGLPSWMRSTASTRARTPKAVEPPKEPSWTIADHLEWDSPSSTTVTKKPVKVNENNVTNTTAGGTRMDFASGTGTGYNFSSTKSHGRSPDRPVKKAS